MPTITKDQMEVAMTDGDKLVARIADAGEMAFMRVNLPAGTDMAPAIEAVAGPHGCQVPHWMFVLSGELRIHYNDGHEDVGRPGDFIYALPGHTPSCEVETEFIEVSPREPIRELLARVTGAAATA